MLSAAGIDVYTGAQGLVREAVEQLEQGRLQQVSKPTVASHFGMKAAPGQGFGAGGGVGMGRGRGVGRGGGGGRGRGGLCI